jgi:two-component system, NtrC family, sensor histidine kinase HydH
MPRPFSLLRWFGALSFVTVTAAAVGTAAAVSHFLAAEILNWDAELTAEFIVTVAETQSVYGGYPRKTGVAELLGGIATAAELGISETTARASTAEFFDHMRALPGATFIRVYARDRRVVWSYAAAGHEEEPEDAAEEEPRYLDKAFAMQYAGSSAAIGRWDYHLVDATPDEPGHYFVENYVPLYDSQSKVAAVVEIYKEPAGLLGSIRRGQTLVWTSLLIAGALIFLTLFMVVRRAAVVMQDQQKRLVDAETLAVLGEMSLAVAHGIRNPVSAIRCDAELILDTVPEGPKRQVQDIIRQADRLSHWLRDLLVFSRPSDAQAEKVNLVEILRESVQNFDSRFAQAQIAVEWICPESEIPPVVGNRLLLLQAINSIIANAVEVMSGGGKLTVRCDLERAQGRVRVDIADTGHGMSEARLAQAFRPFNTGKVRGLGIGLTLVKRALERYGGGVGIESRENFGTRVKLIFLVAGQAHD